MMKRVRGKSLICTQVILMLIISLAMVNIGSATPSPAKVYVDPANPIYNPTESFNISVKVENAPQIMGFQFKLRWDKSVLAYPPNATEGTFLKNAGSTIFTVLPNFLESYVHVSSYLTGDVSAEGNGTLATLTFYVQDSGVSELIFLEATLYDYPNGGKVPDVSAQNGFFHTTKPYVDFTWTPDSPEVNEAATFDASACWNPDALSLGEVSFDRHINIKDVVKCALAFGSKPGDPNWDRITDVNGDGVIDIFDIVTIGVHYSYISIMNYTWDFGDSNITVTENPVITHKYANYADDPYVVNLTVTDSEGESWSKVKPLRMWHEIQTADIWPSIYVDNPAWWMDTVDYEANSTRSDWLWFVVTCVNLGTYTDAFNVSLYADLNTTVIGDELTLPWLWFDPDVMPAEMEYTVPMELGPHSGSGWDLMFHWDTTNATLGAYTVTAVATPVSGEFNTVNNNLAIVITIVA